VSLAQQHRGHPAAACLDDEPEHVPDVAVRRVHVVAAVHLVLTGQLVGDGVDGHGLRDRPRKAWRGHVSRHHGARAGVIRPQDIRFKAPDGFLVVLIAREVRRLGGIQLLELGPAAAQPDLVLDGVGFPGIDKAERDNRAEPVRGRLDHKMGDCVISWPDDQGPELAAVAVGAANVGP
jgi:hypothetical protein